MLDCRKHREINSAPFRRGVLILNCSFSFIRNFAYFLSYGYKIRMVIRVRKKQCYLKFHKFGVIVSSLIDPG